jgi:uncharacterized RDD family membrane protein YckC
MQQSYVIFGQMDGLPDPEHDAQYYEGVTARRLAAWVIDLVVILLAGVPIALVFGIATFGIGFALFPFVVATVGFLYRVATISQGSATWGMRVMGIELRRHDGTRFDLFTSVLHTAIYSIAFWTVVLQILSCVTILVSRYRQGIQDIILRTTAINRPAD